MQHKQQQLQVKLKNTPVDASQVHCSVSSGLNREETLSVQNIVRACNNLDVNLHQRIGGLKAKVFVLNIESKPLMPCTPAKARHLLRDGKAEVVYRNPFTIRLRFECDNQTQPIALNIDAGHSEVGFSAKTSTTELISGELKLRKDVSKKLEERSMYRRLKRNKLWYRKPRFNNRTNSKPKGWLAPSIQHKVETHIRVVNKIKSIVPITKTTIEVAKFDTQKLQNADITGVEYQQGQMQGYDNLRAFVFYRDKHTCQICKKKKGILQTHHIIQKKDGGSNRPDNLVTVHAKCHEELHANKIQHKFTKPKSFKSTVIMNNIRKYVAKKLDCEHTYGYITKRNRLDAQLPKTHINDAFVMTGGTTQTRVLPHTVKQVRRNNRCTQTNRKGYKPSIRRHRYKYHPHDIVKYLNRNCIVKGVHSYGKYIQIVDKNGKPINTKIQNVSIVKYGQGLNFEVMPSIHPPFENGGFLEGIL